MASRVVYNAGNAGTATLNNPSVTITHSAVKSDTQRFIQQVVKVYTIRAIISASGASALNSLIEQYKQVLNVSGGVFSLYYDNDATPFITFDSAKDTTYGPHPALFQIEQLIGKNVARIVWQITVSEQVANDISSPDWAWVDFSYTVTIGIDTNMYQTRTISGILIMAGNHALMEGKDADAFRNTVETSIPPVPAAGSWRRVSRNYTLSQDGRTLGFTIQDQQTYSWLPPNITAGDLKIRTGWARNGNGQFSLQGFFESSPSFSRSATAYYAQEVMNLFLSTAIMQIAADVGTAQGWTINLQDEYREHSWMSNRIDFGGTWELLGQFDDAWMITNPALQNALTLSGIPLNMMMTLFRVQEFLAYLSQSYVANYDEGAYTKYPVVGTKNGGSDAIAQEITIDVATKLTSFVTPPNLNPTALIGNAAPDADSTTKSQRVYATFEQQWSYVTKTNRVVIPTKGGKAIVQQTSEEEWYLYIDGEATSYKEPPVPPLLPYPIVTEAQDPGDAVSAILMQRTISPASPTADGMFRLTWKYVYLLTGVPTEVPIFTGKVPHSPLPSGLPWITTDTAITPALVFNDTNNYLI